MAQKINVERCNIRILPSQSRILIKPYIPDNERVQSILARIFSLTESQVRSLLSTIRKDFADDHFDADEALLRRFQKIESIIPHDSAISQDRKLLIGAYFTHEYTLESAGLCNPSIVPHYNQSGLLSGELRFIMSLRAVGEGHTSSVVFREGIIKNNNQIVLEKPTPYVTEPIKEPNPFFLKHLFIRKLGELGKWNDISRAIIERLKESFSLEDLMRSVVRYTRENSYIDNLHFTIDTIKTLAYSNYEVYFTTEHTISERVIFPSSPSESNGIEDARFVLFRDDDDTRKYIATYTAYDGKVIFPQLLETDDFLHFKFLTLNGDAAKNKGMALFPRKINGQYAMLSRQDNENLYLVYSDNLHFWFDAIKIMRPSYPWEFIQIGNCGSPLETDEGWLVLSHGVGPLRKYCIGAFLLDKEDPSRVIARLPKPLLEPKGEEKEGYVPNVVYSCGALIHNRKLILPYAMSDYATSFAIADVKEIINEMI
jgi:predicted GH43/DUF377 family glycosyl hydrolase